MKFFRKALTFFVFASLVLSLLSCSKTETALKQDKGIITIGITENMDSGESEVGRHVEKGVSLAVKEINEAGGINGIPVETVIENDGNSINGAQSAYESLISRGMDVLITGSRAEISSYLSELTFRDNILQIAPACTISDCSKNPNSFRTCFTDSAQCVLLAQSAFSDYGYRRVAVLSDSNNKFSHTASQFFQSEFTRLGGQIVYNETFNRESIESQLRSISESGANAIFVPMYTEAINLIVETANRLGITLPYIGTDTWCTIPDSSPSIPVGDVIFPSVFTPVDSETEARAFIYAFKDVYDILPNQYAALGYDSVYVLKAAIENNGVSTSDQVTTESLIDSLTQIAFEGISGKIAFNINGESDIEPEIARIKDGQYFREETVETEEPTSYSN